MILTVVLLSQSTAMQQVTDRYYELSNLRLKKGAALERTPEQLEVLLWRSRC